MNNDSNMLREINEIPSAIEKLIEKSEQSIIDSANAIRAFAPVLVTTVARGSSDHAAAYLKYAIELLAKTPVASIGPSISSVYGVELKLCRALNISISQSGLSPDIIQMTQSAKSGGALIVSLTNNINSDMASASHHVIDICADEEKSVAATKTVVTSIVSGLLLLAHWQQDHDLIAAIKEIPKKATKAIECYWSVLSKQLLEENRLYILGRGPGMAIAHEAALKFKETCQIHAEAYSSAEVMHGPKSIIGDNFTVVAFATEDESENTMINVLNNLEQQGANVFATTNKNSNAVRLPFIAGGHPLINPLLLLVTYYIFIEKLARARGLDPDSPPHLKKVTETI